MKRFEIMPPADEADICDEADNSAGVFGEIPALRPLVLEALKIRCLERAYSEFSNQPLQVYGVLGQAVLGRIYKFTAGLCVEEFLPSFEASCQKELRCVSTVRLANEGAYGFANLFNAHRIHLLETSEALSIKFCKLRVGIENEAQREKIDQIHDLFLDGGLEKKFPSMLEEMAKTLNKEFLYIHRLLEDEFIGSDGIFYEAFNVLTKQNAPIDAEKEKKQLLSKIIALSHVSNFFWWYSRNLLHYSGSEIFSSIFGNFGNVTSFFSNIQIKIKILEKFINSDANLQELFKANLGGAEEEIEEYCQDTWSVFESRDSRSSKKSLIMHLNILTVLCDLLKQNGEKKAEIPRVEDALKKLSFLIRLFEFQAEATVSWRNISRRYVGSDLEFKKEVLGCLNKDISAFSANLVTLAQIHGEALPGFCEKILSELVESSRGIRDRLAQVKNNTFRARVLLLETELEAYESSRNRLAISEGARQEGFQLEVLGKCYFTIENIFRGIEFCMKLYTPGGLQLDFWLDEKLRRSFNRIRAQASGEVRFLAEKIKRETKFSITQFGGKLLPNRDERALVLDRLENVLRFLLELLMNVNYEISLASNQWWIKDFLSALKQEGSALHKEINANLPKAGVLDKLLMDFMVFEKSELNPANRKDLCQEIVKKLNSEIPLIEQYLRIVRMLEIQGKPGITDIDVKFWGFFAASLINLKLQFDSLGELSPITADIDLEALINFIKRRNETINTARLIEKETFPKIQAFFSRKDPESDKCLAQETLSEIQKAIYGLENDFTTVAVEQKFPIDFDVLSKGQRAFFMEIYFPMQVAFHARYLDRLKTEEEKLLDYLDYEDECKPVSQRMGFH